MKKLIYILFIGILSSNVIFAQNKQEDKPVNKKAPVITFNKLIYDYGTIQKNSDGTCEFVFKNTGKQPLILSNVRSSCGCTVPSWPKEPLKRRKSATIKVKYNTNHVGSFSKSITVYSNASNSPIRLKIKGKVVDNNTKKVTKGTVPYKQKEKISTLPRDKNN